MSKKTESKREHNQPLSGAGALRRNITDVRFVAEGSGEALPLIAVQIRKTWHFLDVKKLSQGQAEDLAVLSMKCRIPMDIGMPDRKTLCAQILAQPTGSLIMLEPDTYQEVVFEGAVHRVFVWRGQANWVDDAPAVVYVVKEKSREAVPAAAGSVEEWQKFAACFSGNHYLVVGLGTALSALLAKPLNVDPLSLIYVGRTSIGKSAIQAAIKSLIRSPALDSSAGTLRGLQQTLSEMSGQPVFLEDIRQQRDTDGLIELLFDIGNRASRNVGHASQTAVKGKAMECVLLASNERTLGELRGGGSYDSGVEARVIELDIDAPHGAFHELPEEMDGAAFAEHLKDGARQFYGTAWDAWVGYAAENLDALRELWANGKEKLQASLFGELEVEGATRRAIKGVAFWKFCLLMAAKEGIVPLEKAVINEAFRIVVQTHLSQRRQGMTRKGEGIVARLRALVEANPTRFPVLTEEALARNQRLGFRKTQRIGGDEVQVYLFRKQPLLAALEEGEKELEHALDSAGLLIREKDGGNKVIKLPNGMSQRMLMVRATLLSDD